MDSNLHNQGAAAGFQVDPISLEEMRQKLIEVRDYFQGKTDTLAGLEASLDDPFFGGYEGETGAFQRSYQAFGHEWIRQFKRMLVLEQRFVNLINEQGEAVKKAGVMYAQADDAARLTLQSILRDIV